MSRTWTPAQAAQFHSDAGLPVVERGGVYWVAQSHGFWHPVDYLQPLAPLRRPPAVTALGHHHLAEPEAATVALPLQIIAGVETFSEARLSKNLHKDLRRCRLRADVEQAPDPELLLAQGYEIWLGASRRTGQASPGSRGRYARLITARWRFDPQIAIVGQRDGVLAGFLTAHVIGAHCLFEEVVIADHARTWCLGVAMYSAALKCARDMGASVAFLGLDTPENPGLKRFKARMGSRVVAAPARCGLMPGVGRHLRTRHPIKCRRLAGVTS